MTKTISIIFPNQLYKGVPIAKKSENIVLIEDTLFFGEKKNISNFHKNKLILHRASMKNYLENELKEFNTKYVNYENADLENIFEKFKGVETVFVYEPKDFLLEKRLKRFTKKF